MSYNRARHDLAEHICESILRLCEEDVLLQQELNERTITHRIASHLEDILGEHDRIEEYPHVDVEYNRIGRDGLEPKRFSEDLKALLSSLVDLLENDGEDRPQTTINEMLEELQNRLIYPDIIVHERGNPKQNLLVLEIKKGRSDTNRPVDRFDHTKLMVYTDDQNSGFDYQYGAFLKLSVGTSPETIEEAILDSAWFENGAKVDENPLEN